MLTPTGAAPDNYRVLHRFTGMTTTDGSGPTGTMVDVNGTLYGTAGGGVAGAGGVFAVTTSGAEQLFSTASPPDPINAIPSGGLVDVNGTLYGITAGGGNTSHCFSGCGVFFSFTTNGTFHPIYRFAGGADGAQPASLTAVNGEFYGTTLKGGAFGAGTVFKVSASGAESVIYSFKGGADPAPQSALTAANGQLYGTTLQGGANGDGSVIAFSLTGTEHLVYSFAMGKGGRYPDASLIDVNGTLYGTTESGGVYDAPTGSAFTGGTVFTISSAGSESVLHSFGNAHDGTAPEAPLTYANGEFYGTTVQGGAFAGGTVFKMNATGVESILHSFAGCADGQNVDGPNSGALVDVGNALFGTTNSGGSEAVCSLEFFQDGTIFTLSP